MSGIDGANQANSFIGEGGFLPSSDHSSQLYIGQWMSDTPIYYDALEIVAEKARRFWWGQQVDLATTAFSLLLAIEGRRRRIPMTTAFLALAHLVSLSFAQNLFYLALLLTPAPLSSDELALPVAPSRWRQIRDRVLPPKPANWHPHRLLSYSVLVLNYGALFMLPYAAETASFAQTVLIIRASTFLPLVLPKVVPVSWGTVHPHPHDAYSSISKMFRFVSTVSFLLHFKATFVALVYNAPNSHYHRHSILIPWDVEERSTWERSTSSLGKVISSVGDHPVVTAVGYDVLASAMSLGIWAAVRATNVQDIIRSSIPFYKPRSRPSSAPAISQERPDTPIKSEAAPAEIKSEPEPEPPMTLRRSGRQRKARLGSVASSSGASEEPAVTGTAAATGTGTVTRKRGRPKKAKPAQEEESAYEPTPSEARKAVEGDVVPPTDLDWESAALVWGLSAVSGLASASSGVFGGECIAR